jgi:uncharacterized protein
MPNHLATETSPYLLQHAENPVDWYPWGAEALEKAKNEDKPIFLSIGYAACHWCHVMAHESFEDPAIARLLNEHFVSIKVDREERPDLDSIYMNAVVAMTGQGGWPMSLFLTPDSQPFYGGTYFPPAARYGMPSFRDILAAIERVWREDRQQTFQAGQQIVAHLQEINAWGSIEAPGVTAPDLAQAAKRLVDSYDWKYGGWGQAPRFPAPMTIEFLLQQASRGSEAALKAALHALRVMQRGGMYDVVGGGFHRYSTDDAWLVPHFEKMLYDNAQLSLVYLHGYLLTGESGFRRTCEQTLDFILRELTHPAGGFYSSLDADTEGEEGKSYLWTAEELRAAFPDPAELDFFSKVYPLPPQGNFEGKLILRRADEDEALAQQAGLALDDFYERLTKCHQRLFKARSQRVRPHTDDKVLTAWNAFTLHALAEAARSLGRSDYLIAAQRNAIFILDHLVVENRLYRAWRDGQARHPAYLEDHAALATGLVSLYQADGNPGWMDWAMRLRKELNTQFSDPAGGFFDTGANQEKLLVRPKDLQDNATPSGNALAVMALLTLAEYGGEGDQPAGFDTLLGSLKDTALKFPTAFSYWLQAMDFAAGPVSQVAIVWPAIQHRPDAMLDAIGKIYHPRQVLAFSAYPIAGASPALLRERPPLNDQPTAYVCRQFVCLRPTTDLAELLAQLERADLI